MIKYSDISFVCVCLCYSVQYFNRFTQWYSNFGMLWQRPAVSTDDKLFKTTDKNRHVVLGILILCDSTPNFTIWYNRMITNLINEYKILHTSLIMFFISIKKKSFELLWHLFQLHRSSLITDIKLQHESSFLHSLSMDLLARPLLQGFSFLNFFTTPTLSSCSAPTPAPLTQASRSPHPNIKPSAQSYLLVASLTGC